MLGVLLGTVLSLGSVLSPGAMAPVVALQGAPDSGRVAPPGVGGDLGRGDDGREGEFSVVEIVQDRLRIGADTTTRVRSDAGTGTVLLFVDTALGRHDVEGIGTLALAGTEDFRQVAEGVLLPGGTADLVWNAPNLPEFVGSALYLQAVTLHDDLTLLSPVKSRPLEQRFRVIRIGRDDESSISQRPVFFVEFDQHLDPRSVDLTSLFVEDIDRGEPIECERSILFAYREDPESEERYSESGAGPGDDLDHGERRTLVSLRPVKRLDEGVRCRVQVEGEITDFESVPMVRAYQQVFETVNVEFPALVTDAAERAFLRQHIEQGRQPYTDTWKEVKREADSALNLTPDPHDGPPPNSDAEFAAIYARWFVDMRWAYALAIAWGMTDDPRYRDKSLEFVTAWTDRFVPARVGPTKWARAIFYDIAGLKTLLALEWVWDQTTEEQQLSIESFFDTLAQSVSEWHEVDTDSRVAPKGTNIKSWDNTMLLAVGRMFDKEEWRDYAYHGATNPWTYTQMLDDAINEDGSVIDEYRKSENPWYEVTYPVYHLQALALFAEIEKHHGIDAWDDVNSDGNSQYDAWRYYFNYVDGTWEFPGNPPDYIVDDFVTSKYYNMLEVFREQDVLDAVSATEPGFDTHIWNRAAGLVHRIGDGMAGADQAPPQPPRDVRTEGTYSRGTVVHWSPPEESNEDETVFAYRVSVNGKLQKQVTCLEHSYELWNLRPDSEYTVVVRAVDFGGNASEATKLNFQTTRVFE